ncbi:unnamed protein product [Cuscuta campestris]|uniref:Uncharacterized protein n=1 Tax=Cuscuta campestris TaxID=132261 RepID=A0A484KHJ6_9ASTE|nr:unnamed protein product [Cuscuta campestris]
MAKPQPSKSFCVEERRCVGYLRSSGSCDPQDRRIGAKGEQSTAAIEVAVGDPSNLAHSVIVAARSSAAVEAFATQPRAIVVASNLVHRRLPIAPLTIEKRIVADLLVLKDLDVVLGDKPEKMSDADWAGLERKAMSVIRLSLTKNVAFNILKEKTTKRNIEALSNIIALVEMKFDDEVQALLLPSSLRNSWSGTVTAVTGSVGPEGFTFDQIRDLVLGRRNTRGSAGDEEVLLTGCVESSVDSWVMDYGASFHATHNSEALQNLVIGDFRKVRLADDKALEKRNKVRFIESRGQNKVVYAREKPRATGQAKDERARKGSRRPAKGIYDGGSSRGSSAKFTRRQWVRRTNIPDVGTSLENFLLSMESVCSQDVPGSSSVRLQWEPVGTEDESGADLAVTDVIGAWESFNGPISCLMIEPLQEES